MNCRYFRSMAPDSDPQAMLAWVDSFPIYAQFGWGLGVWLALLGSLLLLMRSRWAVWSFGLSLAGAIPSLGYQLLLAPPIPGATDNPMMKIMPMFIIVVAILLFWYAWRQEKRGVLR